MRLGFGQLGTRTGQLGVAPGRERGRVLIDGTSERLWLGGALEDTGGSVIVDHTAERLWTSPAEAGILTIEGTGERAWFGANANAPPADESFTIEGSSERAWTGDGVGIWLIDGGLPEDEELYPLRQWTASSGVDAGCLLSGGAPAAPSAGPDGSSAVTRVRNRAYTS